MRRERNGVPDIQRDVVFVACMLLHLMPLGNLHRRDGEVDDAIDRLPGSADRSDIALDL